jgi:hypothetical protein
VPRGERTAAAVRDEVARRASSSLFSPLPRERWVLVLGVGLRDELGERLARVIKCV